VHSSPEILKVLENEAIEYFRESAAAFQKPVMLYSIGKDSSVLLHLARKAFYPGPIPFPLLHVDTTWKFREMISFREQIVKDYDLNLIVHTNQSQNIGATYINLLLVYGSDENIEKNIRKVKKK
jgi:3'-phosphoadenosine 5'-phosphosulfate sulfotransferase (PAPS reductase)/FAD synthetase